ncbi:MAG: ABC transporter ATP-binding protein [Chloroflexi bacterium]|nr:ABC transporter ATP-binding protein [Chloroflexota bacterium]
MQPQNVSQHNSQSLPDDHIPPDIIRLEQLSKYYEEGGRTRAILHAVDARFAVGEFVVLLGKSGSGKSTLLNLVSGIDLPSHGTVWVNGTLLTRLSERERTLFRRRTMGFIFQAFNLIPTLTVVENVTLPLELIGQDGRESHRRAMELLDAVGLADRGNSFPDRLSGGEQQRVAIARALVHNPILVLADEPTGNLDEETSGTVLELLDTLTRRAGKNLLMATHSYEVIGRADRVFHIHDAQLMEEPLSAAGKPWPEAIAPGQLVIPENGSSVIGKGLVQ